MSNWDPCGEKSVPDEFRDQIARDYEESETETEQKPFPREERSRIGCAVIAVLVVVFWVAVGISFFKATQ
jgi:hypothetical protein